ncbi:MAG: hypothetical protein ACLP9L_26275 [Thermoguttaceae bacterium]
MNRSPLIDRFGLRSKASNKQRDLCTHLGIEPLEERRLLSVDNLLVGTFDDTSGRTVLEFSEATDFRLPGGALTGDHGLGQAQGLAAAPDGSYYVSSLASGQVLHFSSAGTYLGVLGAGDAVQAPIYAPGTLAFGPNGNLYVADLAAKAIYQFNLNEAGQEYVAAATLSLGFTPGGFTFAADSTHDLIVGDLDAQSVLRFHEGATTTLIAPGSGINPAAILALSNGNLLIADLDLGDDPTGHHQIVEYDASTQTTSQFINLTTPLGTGSSAGLPPQPTALMLDQDGNLLVGLSPDHNGNGAVEKFNLQTGSFMGTIASGIGTPSGLALVPVAPSDILFSTFDDTNGNSVLRYNDSTQLPVPGGVATGAEGLGYAEGLAVAPDGSYYVSSLATAQVLHFSNSGVFLGALGGGDAVAAPLEEPGTLAFGPNGNLYVADLGAEAVFQFDTSSATQQYLASATLSLGFTPGGIAFAPDLTHDLIVGDLDAQSVLRYHNGVASTLVNPGSGINPGAILSEVNGDLLIADFDLGNDPSGHHQIVQYDAATGTTSQFIDLTTPVGTGASAGYPPQPTALTFDTDGNLLVGLSPDQTGDGAIEKFNIQTGSLMSTIASGIGAPSGLALVPSQVSDLLVGDFDADSVLRYSTVANSLVGGGVASGDNGLGQTQGVAVAPDGSFYVSSLVGQILHYSNAGVFLNVLNTSPAPIYAPGSLAFGPDGNLYVADLASQGIYQFDTASTTQPYLPADTLSLGFTPGGFAFANDATRDLIVGDLDDQSVVQYHDDGSSTTLIDPGSGINPASILALSNGNLLIADLDLGGDPSGHHQIVEYNASTQTTSQFIDLTAPVGTGDFAGDPPQPTSLLLDQNGNLLVGLSPDHNGNGAVEKFDMADQQLISTVISSIGTPAGLALVPPNEMTVAATDWTSAGLTVTQDDGILHVYRTGATNPNADVIPPQPASSVGGIQIIGPNNAVNALEIDFGGGSPIPPGGVDFYGGLGSATNTVIINDPAGSNSYSLNGAQLSRNNVPAVTLANTQALSLNLGRGSLDLGGGVQAITSFTLTSGTLDVTTSAALPAGAGLAVGANAASMFGSSAVVLAPRTLSSNSAAVDALPATTGSARFSAPRTQAAAAVAAPSQGPVVVTVLKPASVTRSAWLAVSRAPLPAAQPADSPSNVASDSLWRSYNRAADPAVVQASGAAGYLAWWNSSVLSSSAEDTTTGTLRRIAASDAVLTQYGSP